MWKRLACQMCVSSQMFFLCRRLNSASRFPCRRRALRLLLFVCSFFFFEPAWRLFSRWRGKETEMSTSTCERYSAKECYNLLLESGLQVLKGNIVNLTILLATSLSLRGSRLVLWLMARLLMCLGRAPNTWQLPVVLVTAFSMALTSAALALAKAPAERG